MNYRGIDLDFFWSQGEAVAIRWHDGSRYHYTSGRNKQEAYNFAKVDIDAYLKENPPPPKPRRVRWEHYLLEPR